MAFITVGINTDRVYNKKNPPGGKCTDLFGGPPDEISANPKKLNRLRSSVDLGGSEDSSEAAPRQKKSQPSVCPLTGEKIGVREESKPESKPANTNGTSGTNGTLVREGAEAPAPAPTEGKSDAAPAPAATPATAPAAESVTAPETTPAPAAAPASDAPPAPEPTVSDSTPVPAPAPVAEPAPASAPASAPVSTPAPTPAPASTPAPVTSSPASSVAPAPARRRNPPGGHSAGFW